MKIDKTTQLQVENSSTDSTNDCTDPPPKHQRKVKSDKNFTIAEIIKSPIQCAFLVFALFAALLIIPFTYQAYTSVRKWSNEAPEGYDYPQVSDFKVLALSSLVYIFTDKIMQTKFQTLFVDYIKNPEDSVISKQRLRKTAVNMSGGIQMIFQTILGYYILKDQFYMPKSLGGSGDYSLMFKDHPYQEHAPYLKQYYLVVASYHMSSIIQHLCHTRENDFVEMLFHHTITLYLMFGSYMMNMWECGAVISFLHDFTDCFGHFVKVFAQTTLDCFTVPIFACVLVSWGYMRNIVFPFCIYDVATSGMFKETPCVLPIYIFLLSCLVVLHYYWYSIFLRILYTLVCEGAAKTEDIQCKVSVEERDEGDTQQEEVANIMNELENKEKCD